MDDRCPVLGGVYPLGTYPSSSTFNLNEIVQTSVVAFTNAEPERITGMPSNVSKYGCCHTYINTGSYGAIQEWIDFQDGKRYTRNKYNGTWYDWK